MEAMVLLMRVPVMKFGMREEGSEIPDLDVFHLRSDSSGQLFHV
jgi:hypothetical protein